MIEFAAVSATLLIDVIILIAIPVSLIWCAIALARAWRR